MAANCNIIVPVDDIIENNDFLRKILSTNNTLADFKPDDVVTCTYFKGFCKVTGIHDSKVEVQTIDNTSEILKIRPNYLKKVVADRNLLKVLYETTGFKNR